MGTMGILHVWYKPDLSQKRQKRGELFFQLNQSCWKLHEMDRFSLKSFPSLAARRLFCQLKQSCWKLHEMDRFGLKIFPYLATWAGAFLPGPRWDVQWCMKYGLAKLHHMTWCELSISPKGRRVWGIFGWFVASWGFTCCIQ